MQTPLFTANDSSGQLMPEPEFWTIIDRSRTQAAGNYQAQQETLQMILQELEPAQIARFDNTFHALLAHSYDYRLWGAAYVINGGCSDDCFDYFREYLIGQGQERFYQTVRDPESCAAWVKSEDEENWEGLVYAAGEAYTAKTGQELPRDYHMPFELNGEEFDEDSVDELYPKLAAKFSGA